MTCTSYRLVTNMKIKLLIAFLSFSKVCLSQDSISVISGDFIEDLVENNDETNYDFYSLYDELKSYLDDPLDLNDATEEDLKNLGVLNSIQIEDIINHRKKYGDFLSPYELQSIPSMDLGTLNATIPFITTGSDINQKNIIDLLTNSRQNIVTKYKRVLQTKKGYTNEATSPYLGNPDYYYIRYNLTSGRNLRVGMTMEKDAGEEFFKGSNKQGFDYYTGFIYLKDIHPLFRTVNIGDYSISMGQGLIMHNSFGTSKSSSVLNVKRGGRVVKPYSSVNEFNLLRGIATTMQLGNDVRLSLFGSRKKIDGNTLQNDTIIDTGFGQFSSFVTNGLHRTQSEIDKRRAITQYSTGGSLKLLLPLGVKLGVNSLYTRFDSDLEPRDELFRKYNFRGNQLTNTSIDYSFRYENFNFFGETAMSDNRGIANIHGTLISLGRDLDAALVYRNYQKDYQVLNGNAFGEIAQPTNEQGMYFALKARPWRNITLSTYFDTWRHPWLRSNADAPTKGKEYLAKAEYKKKRKYNIYIQYRYEEKEENASISRIGTKEITTRKQHRARANFTYSYSKELNLTSRIEYNYFTKDDLISEGFLIYQDLKYKPIEKPYSIALRYTLFDTDDFNSRIYAYENDVLYEFSVPFLYESGSRFYVKGQYAINRNLYIQLRYARTYFNNLEDIRAPDGSYLDVVIGSGNEQSFGRVRSDLKLVMKYTIK